jgi:hypothetical protein
LKELLTDWRNLIPIAGLIVLAVIAAIFWLRRKPGDPGEAERERRAYLNRIGRIVEGQVLEILDGSQPSAPNKNPVKPDPVLDATPGGRHEGLFSKGQAIKPGSDPKLLHYTYSISGVTYETAQDITGLEERVHLSRVAAGQVASVKYDPSNPSNSILLADDWSGLH